MPITVAELLIGRPQPTTVRFDQTGRDAVDLMVEYDYSQIPVVDDNGRPLGMVTSDSILRALRYFGVSLDALRVTDALVDTDEYRAGEDLSGRSFGEARDRVVGQDLVGRGLSNLLEAEVFGHPLEPVWIGRGKR